MTDTPPTENPFLDQTAWMYAQRYLTAQPRTSGQVRRKLQQRQYDPPVVEAVIEALAEAGALDDQAYAADFVRMTLANRPMGRILLRARLARRLLPAAVIDAALQEHCPPEAERDAAARAFAHKARELPTTLPRQKRHEKLGRYLASRGFPAGMIWDLLKSGDADESA